MPTNEEGRLESYPERPVSLRVFGRLPGTEAMRDSEAGVGKASKEETAGEFAATWCRSMGNLSPRLDLICRFRTGRRLTDERGADFDRPGCDRRGDLVVEIPGFARRRSLSAKHGRCR